MLGKGLIYVVGEVLSKATPILFVPYLSQSLGLEGFGYLALALSYSQLISIFVGFSVHASISRYYFRYGARNILNLVLTYFIWSSIFVIILSLIVLTFSHAWLIPVILYSWFSYIFTIKQTLLQCQKKAKEYVVSQVLYSVLGVLGTVVIFETYSASYLLRINALTATYIILLVPFISGFILWLRRSSFRVGRLRKLAVYQFAFGCPLLLHSLSNYIRTESDKLLIYNVFEASELGVYSLGAKLGLGLLTVMLAFNKAIQPIIFENLKLDRNYNVSELIGKKGYLILFFLMVIVYFIPNSIFVYIVGYDVKYFFFMFFCSSVMLFPYLLHVNKLFYFQENKIIGYYSVFSAVLYLAIIFILSFIADIKLIPLSAIISNAVLSSLVCYKSKKVKYA